MYKAIVGNRTIEFAYSCIGSCISGGLILWLKDKDRRIIEGFKLDEYRIDDECDGLVRLSRIK